MKRKLLFPPHATYGVGVKKRERWSAALEPRTSAAAYVAAGERWLMATAFFVQANESIRVDRGGVERDS